MALWQLLVLICFSLPIGFSLAAAEYGKVGLRGYALASAVGLVVGGLCAWIMWVTHKIVVDTVRRSPDGKHSPSQREWFFRAFYVAKMLWTAIAGFIGFWLSSALIRLVITKS
jgi:hypothetical protein